MPRDGARPDPSDLEQQFREAGDPTPEVPEPLAYEWEDEGLDHLEATLDYTPGGSIEQIVNTELSDRARAAYRERQQPAHDDDSAYERQVNQQFERAAAQDEAERIAAEQAEEREIEEALATDEFGGKDPEMEQWRRQQAEIEKLAAETEQEPSAWYDDPQKAAEYLAWSQQQEAERSDAEHQQTLDRLAQTEPYEADAGEPSAGAAGATPEREYPRLYQAEQEAHEADDQAGATPDWDQSSGRDLGDAWDSAIGPDISPGDGWDAPGAGAGGHEH